MIDNVGKVMLINSIRLQLYIEIVYINRNDIFQTIMINK
jgi:hypothetical protein